MQSSSSSPAKGSLRRPLLFTYLAALAFYALFLLRTSFVVRGERHFVLFEDAMISMRYARNLAVHGQFTWNVGEERVEGYTNLLWTLWMALFHKLGVPESKIALPIMVTGVGIMVGLGLLVGRIARQLDVSKTASAFASLSILACYPLVFWTLRGMEVGAVSLLVTAQLSLALDIEEDGSWLRAAGMGLLGGAAVLLRSDSAVSVGLIGLYAALSAPRGKRILLLVLFGVPVAATVLGHTLFRLNYYGDKLPNTAYLKLIGIPVSARIRRGVFVMAQVATYHLALPLATILGGISVGGLRGGLRDRFTRRLLLLVTLIAVQWGYAVYVGGDAWEWMLYANRYMSASMPLVVLLVTAMIAHWAHTALIDEQVRQRAITAMFLAILVFGVVLLGLQGWAKKAPEVGIAKTIVFSKKAAAGAVLLMLIGGVGMAVRGRLGARLATVVRAFGQGASYGTAFAVWACIWVPGQLEALGGWALKNAAQYRDEERYAKLGMLLAKSTDPQFRIAVAAAGATPYFADRPTEDLLGKNDKTIARGKLHGVFSPGHDKWDYSHSLGKQKPDMIIELVDTTSEDEAYVSSLGYKEAPNGLRYRMTGRPARAALGMPFETRAEIESALEAAETQSGLLWSVLQGAKVP
jgi:hypothetical protein